MMPEPGWYQVAKDFAGPVATIVASGAAALITWTFASRQLRFTEQQAVIARQQAHTALDQLRQNLFEKRYAVYSEMRNLLHSMITFHEIDDIEVIRFQVLLREARFFFQPEVVTWLEEIWSTDISDFLNTRVEPGKPHFAKIIRRLISKWEEFPIKFNDELRFAQLTSGGRETKA